MFKHITTTALFLLLTTNTVFASVIVDIKIQGMLCELCMNKISKQLNTLPNVLHAQVSYKKQSARVHLQSWSEQIKTQIHTTITTAGYTPTTYTQITEAN